MENCIFCKIAQKLIPSQIEFEDDNFIAFSDIHPKAPTHILIIPKKHYAAISALKDDDFLMVGNLIKAAAKIAIEKGIEHSGYRLLINSGKDAGMEVDHLHLHLLGGEPLSNLN